LAGAGVAPYSVGSAPWLKPIFFAHLFFYLLTTRRLMRQKISIADFISTRARIFRKRQRFTTHALSAPAMRRAGRGSIVNISSVLGTMGTEFHASKGAVHVLTRASAMTLAPLIRVNTVTPSITTTDMA
jgi:NAD(P)-dependent dehydrogenase (short-subunit alcohol dehydrogenase family)